MSMLVLYFYNIMGIFYQSWDDVMGSGVPEPLKQMLILDGVELQWTVDELFKVLLVAQSFEGKLWDLAKQLLQIMGENGSLWEAIDVYKKK